MEILYFEGCPNYRAAIELVRRVAPGHDVRLTEVAPEDVEEMRFLGSPTIRVGGQDIEPGAAARAAYVYACRVYPNDEGLSGLPDPRWIRDALS